MHNVSMHIQIDIETHERIYTLTCSCGEQDELYIPESVPFRETVNRIEEAAAALAGREKK